MKKFYLLLVTLFFVTSAATAQNYFDNFPVNADPKTVGEKLSKRFLESKHQLYFDKGIHYGVPMPYWINRITENPALLK